MDLRQAVDSEYINMSGFGRFGEGFFFVPYITLKKSNNDDKVQLSTTSYYSVLVTVTKIKPTLKSFHRAKVICSV